MTKFSFRPERNELMTIVETTDNRFFNVRVLAGFDHIWEGVEVKKVAGVFTPKKNARPVAVRKAGARILTNA